MRSAAKPYHGGTGYARKAQPQSYDFRSTRHIQRLRIKHLKAVASMAKVTVVEYNGAREKRERWNVVMPGIATMPGGRVLLNALR
jgi:hypothetical protein